MNDETKDILFRDLAMRLPYGVVVKAKGWHYKTPVTVENIWHVVHTNHEAKPILRSLSDLSDQQLILLGYQEAGIKTLIEDIQQGNIEHVHFMYLIENHYDVSLLIERGMAVDVNTIETDPYN